MWTWRGLISGLGGADCIKTLTDNVQKCSSAILIDCLCTLHILQRLYTVPILKSWCGVLNFAPQSSTQSGIWGTLNTIAVRQLGIDFQYIQIKSFDNNPTSQLALGISGLRWIFDCRRSEDSQEIQIDVKAIVCVIKWNRPVLLAFLCISRVLSARVGTSNTNRLAKSFLANRAWHQSFIYHPRITNWFLIWWLNTKSFNVLSFFFAANIL